MAIANRIARAIYKIIAGDSYKEIGYGKAADHEIKIKTLVNQLRAMGVQIRHEGHQKIVSSKKIKIDDTGVQLT